ncbi:MAG: LytTR family transcriptional regulator [Clostridia bacterium]|nr:LytTR family transcriptional regulator [Clostridia bacterium]
MKIRIEISEQNDDEIVIRCRQKTDKISAIETAIENALKSRGELVLYIGSTEYYVQKSEILFFEASGGKVFAHTRDGMFTAQYKLFELEDVMPSSFTRISKSVIANINLISSLRRELTGNGEITFKGSDKKTYFSRAYYKILKDKIEEVRFGI